MQQRPLVCLVEEERLREPMEVAYEGPGHRVRPFGHNLEQGC